MNTFWLKIHAPFAAFRGFQAGVYRSTAPVMPPSTAYGLVLNLAGIEMRDYSNLKTTEILKALPCLRLAIGVIQQPEKNSIYQQLHSYRVGTDEKTKQLAKLTLGAKSWLTPVRRELLVNYVGIIGIQTVDETLQEQIKKGLRGELEKPRYGLPFAGDNNLLFDRIDLIAEPPPETYWYARMMPDDAPRKGSCRLTVGIDRADNSKTSAPLFAPDERSSTPPESAWTWTPHE